MEGKTITKLLDLGSNYAMLLLDNDEVAIVKVVVADLDIDEIKELVGDKATEAEPEKEKKSKKKEPEPEQEEEQEEAPGSEEAEEAFKWQDLIDLDYKGLKNLVKEYDLEANPKDFDKDDEDEVMEFRKEIAGEIDVEVPEEGEEESEETETKDDAYTWKDLKEMDFDELEDVCDEENLETDPDDYEEDDEDKLRKAIAKELKIEIPGKKKK